MLTSDEINVMRDAATELTQPIIAYLLRDIAERIAQAGHLTASAQYSVWKLQELLNVSNRQLRQMLTQSAEAGYRYDLNALPQVQKIPFGKNEALQKIVAAAVQLAQDDLSNITQTLGMVDPYGNALPLQQAYQNCMDFAFMQVSTGAADYNTAVRMATKNLAAKGVRYIDYESGVSTSLEAAVRRSVLGGLGLMQEQISQRDHDDLGANGWEISAHAASAPDHEPIQGKQYSDAEYTALNNSLVRRIGTLNCGHAAFPIILGVTPPQYTPEELAKLREDNEKGITYNGRHYTAYEATQRQRTLEATIRRQRRKILIDEATGDKEKLLPDQIKLQMLNQEYSRFSKAAGLRTQQERMEVVGYNWKQETAAEKQYQNIANQSNSMYDTGSEASNVRAYMQDLPIRNQLRSDRGKLIINAEKQARHVKESPGYIQGRSYVTLKGDELQDFVYKYAGSGEIIRAKNGRFMNKEIVAAEKEIGISIDVKTKEEIPTNRAYIHYSNSGVHVVPTAREKEKR